MTGLTLAGALTLHRRLPWWMCKTLSPPCHSDDSREIFSGSLLVTAALLQPLLLVPVYIDREQHKYPTRLDNRKSAATSTT